MGCDGTTCVLEITGDSNSLRFRWWQRLPPQWSSIGPLLDGLEALRRRARFHLVPVERSSETLSTLIDQGERIAAEDQYLNRIDYPRDVGGVDWREHRAFRKWIGLGVDGKVEGEAG